MRQAGIIAAAGRYALAHNIDRLQEDHDHAALIAGALEQRFPGQVAQATNMVFVDLPGDRLKALITHLASHKVRIRGPRWVLHLDVSDADVARINQAIGSF